MSVARKAEVGIVLVVERAGPAGPTSFDSRTSKTETTATTICTAIPPRRVPQHVDKPANSNVPGAIDGRAATDKRRLGRES